MKIEAEVEHSVYAFHHSSAVAEGQGGGGGCSVSSAEPTPIAQERSSIDRPEWQPPGCGGCGPASSESDHHNGPTSVFDCEHFQFIDEDDEEGVNCENVSATQAPAGEENAAPAPSGSLPRDAEVSSQQQQTHDEMGESESAARARSHAVKRQVSFDDAATARCESPSSIKKEIKSVLKKANRANKKQRNRVTFDEAVTLYSDENEDIQLLALTTGPDIVYTDVFYMYEPPIEYQDVPPFEPPAEYRDSDDVSAQLSIPPVDTQPEIAQQNVSDSAQSEKETQNESCTTEVTVGSVANDQTVESPIIVDIHRSDVAVSKETENSDSAIDETVGKVDTCQQVSDSSLESDKLFERFLEAEREFAVDEELNSVFHALENDFANDDKNGALDDNFFRKLISLLSSAEGDTVDTSVEGNDFFSETNFGKSQSELSREAEDDDNSQTHSRTLSEADSDCSISSQDTIIVRFGEDDTDQNSVESTSLLFNRPVDIVHKDVPDNFSSALPSEKGETYDEVFAELSESASSSDERPRPLPRESLLIKSNHVSQVVAKIERANEESLSRQSSGEQSVNSANSQDPPQDADDSTSSDSRSGEVEEEIRLDDIGYDEEDAEDYDEESFRGMAHGSSKIRRIIKKNALQCTLFRGIEAKRRQQPGAKYPRPKSPLLSQESLVEKLKWLTTIDEHKDADGPLKFHSKPPDVILSTGGVPVNGSIPHSASSEDDISNQSAQGFHPPFYQVQQRHVLQPNSQGGYYMRRDGFPPTHHPSLPRQRISFSGHSPQMMHSLPYLQNRVVAHPSTSQMQWSEQQRPMSSMTVPRNFRDWRVIQRVTGNRGNEGSSRNSQVTADYVRCPNGSIAAYPVNNPPDVSRTSQVPANKDELEQFVEKDSKRMEMIRKRYSVAEEEDDPTFGFARRPSVKGVQKQIQSKPSETVQGHGTNKVDPYVIFEGHTQGPPLVHPRSPYTNEQMRVWNRDPNWRPDNLVPSQLYGPPTQGGRSQVPMHIHRASVALTELPGNATIPYTHRKPPQDVRYHSYAESMYGSTRTLPTKGWLPPDPRTCHIPNPVVAHQTLPLSNIPLPAVSSPMLQVPPHSVTVTDERGVPEGASSSPKISSDSLYHAPVPDAIATGGPHKEDGMIYYSLNV